MAPNTPLSAKPCWHLYIIRCGNGTLYTGITTDVLRRFGEHESQGVRCAKYLRGKLPLTLLFQTAVGDRSDALRLEHRVKQLSHREKAMLVSGYLKVRDLTF